MLQSSPHNVFGVASFLNSSNLDSAVVANITDLLNKELTIRLGTNPSYFYLIWVYQGFTLDIQYNLTTSNAAVLNVTVSSDTFSSQFVTLIQNIDPGSIFSFTNTVGQSINANTTISNTEPKMTLAQVLILVVIIIVAIILFVWVGCYFCTSRKAVFGSHRTKEREARRRKAVPKQYNVVL